MSTRIPANLRRVVVERAHNQCEYCLIHQDLLLPLINVIADKHGGATDLENLALSCMICNLRKSSDIASFDPDTRLLTALFNPRTQSWSDHFTLDGACIIGLTSTGRTTVAFLQFNSYERQIERAAFIRAGVYPIA